METDVQGYWIAWSLYLLAAAIGGLMAWRVLHRWLQRDLAIVLECLLLALLFTPWYVLPGQGVMAPAFIVALFDTITIDAEAGVRALVPLIMALLLSVIAAIVLMIAIRVGRRKA